MNAHSLRGQVLMEQQRYKEAAEEFKLAITEEPDDAFGHASLANALLLSGRPTQALESVGTALQKDASCAFAFWVMAMLRMERQEWTEAEQAIRSAIELEPDDASNHGLLARIHCERRNFEAALQAANAGLALDAQDDLCLTFRSRALMGLGRAAEARQDADTLLADDPEDDWNHCLRADQLLAARDYEGARRHYLEALRIDSRNAAARHGLALSLKARSPVFSLLLRALVQLDRCSAWASWMVIILLFVSMRIGRALTRAHPEWLVPYEAALALVWGVTILMFIANPVFDLVLRFDRETRHVLTEDEIKATNWYLVCFGFAALCAVWATFGKAAFLARICGLTALYLTRAVTEVFEASPGYVRRRMSSLTIAAGSAVVLTPVFLGMGAIWLLSSKQAHLLPRLAMVGLSMPLAVMLFTAFVDDIRQYFEKRRPD